MISWISNWTQGVIVSVIVASVIEMVIPEGSSKKYIKVVIGIFILFSILSPVVNKFKSGALENVQVNLNMDNKTKEVSASQVDKKAGFNIMSIYEANLKADIKSKIKAKGFNTGDINVEISKDDKYEIEKLEICIISKADKENINKTNKNNVIGIVDTVDKVSIELSNKIQKSDKEYKISQNDEKKLKEYLSETYEINQTNIVIS